MTASEIALRNSDFYKDLDIEFKFNSEVEPVTCFRIFNSNKYEYMICTIVHVLEHVPCIKFVVQVTSLDSNNQTVTCKNGDSIKYDKLLLAMGAT